MIRRRGRRRQSQYAWLSAAGVVAVLGLATPVLAQPTCPVVSPLAGGHRPAVSGCCAALSPALSCPSVSPALQGGKRNVVFAVLDDFGHCMSGFMGGRCARQGTRCEGKVCSNARWLACSSTADCPPGDPPSGCNAEVVTCAAANPAECPLGCANGYCAQCTTDADCGADICVDGLCSPRAACTGDFQCARGLGTCSGGTCADTGTPCGSNADCNDTCAAGRCRRTPSPCGRNGTCAAGYVCTSASTPLRLNDQSCRYRVPGDQSWEFSRSVSGGEQNVYTPRIDALARTGAVFPRSRGNGEVCSPSRGALLWGRPLRHLNATSPLRTIAQWLEFLMPPETTTVAVGKTEIGSAAALGFDIGLFNGETPPIGKFPCDGACEQALDAGLIPDAATCHEGVTCPEPNGSADFVMDTLRPTVSSNGQQQKRFFLWWAPRLPHVGSVAPNYFQEFYGTPGAIDEGQDFLARTAWVDAALGALLDELARTCVCGEQEDAEGNPTGQPAVESLYDNTVVVVSPDNAVLLPGAKSDKLAPENAHRHSLVINPPGPRRLGASPAVVLDEQAEFSGHHDVLPTVLDYFGVSDADGVEGYAYSRTLRPFVQAGNAAGYVREAFYGHRADSWPTPGGERAYVVPRPGRLGLCQAGTNAFTASGHVRPCLTDAQCGTCSTPPCCARRARRCVTRPGVRCSSDLACATGTCSGPTGAKTCHGDYGDFNGLACTSDRDCVPRGACRPPMLKVYQHGSPRAITTVYDLNLDPDQTTDLRAADPLYLGALSGTCPPPAGATLANQLECCLREFWSVDSPGVWRPRNCGCPSELRGWTPDPGAAACNATVTPSSP